MSWSDADRRAVRELTEAIREHTAELRLHRRTAVDVARRTSGGARPFSGSMAARSPVQKRAPRRPKYTTAEEFTAVLDEYDSGITAIVAEGGDEKYRTGTELHGKLRALKADLDAYEGGDKPALRERMLTLTTRLLVEVFGYTPPEATEDTGS